jgi:hypothetical protein
MKECIAILIIYMAIKNKNSQIDIKQKIREGLPMEDPGKIIP